MKNVSDLKPFDNFKLKGWRKFRLLGKMMIFTVEEKERLKPGGDTLLLMVKDCSQIICNQVDAVEIFKMS